MAKKSSDEYLAGILKLLDDTIKENKKAMKDAGASNAPAGAGVVFGDAKSIQALGNSMKYLSSAIVPFKEVSKEDINNIVDNIKNLAQAISAISIDKKAVEGLNLMVGAINTLNSLLQKFSGNFVKSMFDLSPLKAHIIGKRLSKFYNIILGYLGKLQMGILIRTLKDIPNTKAFQEKITSFQNLLNVLKGISAADVKLFSMMGKQLDEKKGKNIGKFFSAIIDNLTKGDKSGEKAKAAAEIAKSLAIMVGILTVSLIAIVATIAIAGIGKVAMGIGAMLVMVAGAVLIIRWLSSNKIQEEQKNTKGAVQTILLLFGGLTLGLVVLSLVGMMPGKAIATGAGLLVGEIVLALGIIWVLSSDRFKEASKSSKESVESILILFGGLTLGLLVLSLIGLMPSKMIWTGIGLLVGLIVVSLGIMWVLSSDRFKKNAADSMKSTEAILILLGSMTIALIVAILIGKFPRKDLRRGAMILGTLIVTAVAIMWILSMDRFKKNAESSLKSAQSILLLIGGLTIVLLVAILIAKFPTKDILKGFAILGGVVALAIGVMFVLSTKKFKKMADQSLKAVVSILVLFVGMTLALLLTTLVAKYARQVAIGGTVVTGFTVLAIGLLFLLSKIKKKDIINGLLGGAAIVALMVGITAAMILFGVFLDKIKNIKSDAVWRGFGVTMAMVGGMLAIAMAIGAILFFPITAGIFWAGVAGTAAIVALILGLSVAMMNFGTFLEKISKISNKDFEDAVKKITGDPGMLGCIRAIINGLSGYSFKAAYQMAAIGRALRPVFESLSQFVDVIQKMAKMEILDHYDENGHPIYRKMQNSEFTEAAVTVTNAFTYFITELSKGLQDIGDSAHLRQIIDVLFPPKPGGFLSLFKSQKKGLGDIIPCVAQFVETIVKLASLTIPTKWNKEGAPIEFRKVTTDEILEAAVNVTQSFMVFVKGLSTGLTEISNSQALADIIRILFPPPKVYGFFSKKVVEQPGLGVVIQAISSFIDIILRMTTNMVPDKWDKKGTPIHYRKVRQSEYLLAAQTVTRCFIIFLKELGKGLDSTMAVGAYVVKKLADTGLENITVALGELMNPIIQIAGGKFQVGKKVVDITPEKLLRAGVIISLVFKQFMRILGKDGFGLFKTKFMDSDDLDKVKVGIDKILNILPHMAEVLGDKKYVEKQEAMLKTLTKLVAFLAQPGVIRAQQNAIRLKTLAENFVKALNTLMKPRLFNLVTIMEPLIERSAIVMSKLITFISKLPVVLASFKSKYLAGIAKKYLTGISTLFLSVPVWRMVDWNFTSFMKGLKAMKAMSKYLTEYPFDIASSIRFEFQMRMSALAIKHIQPYLVWTPKGIKNLAKALKKLDDELILRSKKRTEALQSISSNFQNMSENIQQLNNTLSESLRLMDAYDKYKSTSEKAIWQKGANAIVTATERVKEHVIEAYHETKGKDIEAEQKKEAAKAENRQAFANMLAATIANALSQWSDSHKDITVQFGEDGKKIFGDLYGG